MKTTIQKEQRTCDVCRHKETYPWNACLSCGKDICYECSENSAVRYEHDVHASGSGDGVYCVACDERLRREGSNPLHSAYLAIRSLRHEEKAWYGDFEARRKVAQDRLKQLQAGQK